MILTLMKKNSIHSQTLPEKIQGQYWIKNKDHKNGSEEILSIEAAGSVWMLKSTREAVICNRENTPIRECELMPLCFYKIKMTGGESALLYCEDATEDRKVFKKLIFSSNCAITIGRDASNDIVFSNAFVSAKHTEIRFADGNFKITDLKSSNGTFVNEKRVSECVLKPGDVVFIMGLKIIVGKNFISVNNPDQRVRITNNKLLKYQNQEIIDRKPSMNTAGTSVMFYRSPRFKRDIKTFEITVDSPPTMQNNEQTPAILTIGPSATMGLASLTMASVSVVNLISGKTDILSALPMLVMSFAMLCGTLLWPTLIKRYENKKKDKREELRQEKYKGYINSIKDEINSECAYQSEILNENYVPIDVCLSRIKLIQRNLWERTSSHSDFLALRLGHGSLPLDCDIKCQKRKFTLDDDTLQEMQYKLAEQPHLLKNVPITLPLREDTVTGIIGVSKDTTAFAKSLLFQLVSLHSYDEVKVVIICGENDRSWEFAKWLPHLWNDDHTVRYMATNQQEIKELSPYLERSIAERVGSRDFEATETPQYVVFALNQSLAERADFMKQIYKMKKYCGFSVLAVYDELKELPKECSRIVELSPQRSRIYDRDDITGKFVEFSPEFFVGDDEEEYAITLANVTLDTNSEQYKIPSAVTFMEAYDVGKIEYLNIPSRWKENDPITSLDVVIGVDEYGEKFSFDLHEKAHGPHGLIAGTTGSGKSEFIMTYILAMAINYHPSEVAFILIDYKGGGMAKAFEKLPHTAGIITNLDGSEVNRSLVSIKSELRRRQALFNEAGKNVGMSNIDIYKYQRLYREGAVSEPLPHLIIISDEFAELKTQQPDFMAELISTARIGRSLGVHLILATQKPTGVVDDQIVSNSKFRICLKVQDRQDSMEMLKRPEAASLTNTGRFYLQIGNNEMFKMGQAAWAGAKYVPSDRVEKQLDNSVSVVANTGKILKQIRIKSGGGEDTLSQLDAITKYISELAENEGFRQRMLWCQSMAKVSSLEAIEKKYDVEYGKEVVPVVGEYDIPQLQKQMPLGLDFGAYGNIAVYGAAGSGKTTFVTTLMYSLIKNYTPEQVNIYVTDFSAQTLSIFSSTPHVGDVIMPGDNERTMNLFKLLNAELKRRKTLLRDYGGDYSAYQKLSGNPIPCIVVIIHNYTGLLEECDVEENIALLSREGAKRGIYFVITAQSVGAIRHKTLQNFGKLLVMRMNDTLDYSSILGNVGGTVPSAVLGRGIMKEDNVYEFQIARCFEDDEVSRIKSACDEISGAWIGASAVSVPVLPAIVNCDFLSSYLTKAAPNMLPVGVDREKMTVVSFPVFDSSITWVLSDSGDNSVFIQGIAETAEMMDNTHVIVMDPKARFVEDEDRMYSYSSESDDINNAAAEIFDEMLRRHKALKEGGAQTFERVLCIISSIRETEKLLTEENRKNFFDALNNLNKKYGIFFVVSESGDYLNSSATKDWVRAHTSFRDALWLGSGLANHFRLQVDKAPKSIREQIEDGSGFALINGTAVATKFVTASQWEPEE